jgi:hypothetical protein
MSAHSATAAASRRTVKPSVAGGSATGSAPASAPDSVLDDVLTPMERSVKTYLTGSVSKDLVELLAVMAVERPDDPHYWLGLKLLERSPMGPYIATRKEDVLVTKMSKSLKFNTSDAAGLPPLNEETQVAATADAAGGLSSQLEGGTESERGT